MGIQLTNEQQKVVDTKTKDILVAAAAGSGKTAVLVERIMKKILNPEHPVDIDEILIVTFTNDAAAQMRDRIRKTLDKKLSEDPFNENLLRQSERLNYASILTLDSFCAEVVRHNFHALNIDPSFRALDESEARILLSQSVEDVLEEALAADNPAFTDMLRMYSDGHDDSDIVKYVEKLMNFANSHPYPDEWLSESAEALLRIRTPEDFQQSVYVQYVMGILKIRLRTCVAYCEKMLEICRMSGGPVQYEKVASEEYAAVSELANADSYIALSKLLSEITFQNLPRAPKGVTVFDELKDEAKGLRDSYKKVINTIRDDYFSTEIGQMIDNIENCAPAVKILCDLTTAARRRFRERMDEVNAYSFSEIEHMTLELFIEEQNGRKVYTDIAKRYRSMYHEIMVDEYQDSNYVQEYFLKAISGTEDNHPNMFMVGDIKQSIYRFRMTRPELFVGKYDSFSLEAESIQQKILLNRNFRSRKIVLDGINRVFSKMMMKSIGGVAYDEDAFLKYREDLEEYPNEEDYRNEFLLVKSDEAKNGKEADEIACIVKRIRELTDPVNGLRIQDEDGIRIAGYGDIAVLCRKRTYYSQILAAFHAGNIPVVSDQAEGYFDAEEVSNVLNFLRILDNPLQDIPFAAVLTSPMAGFDYEEMALLRIYATELEKSSHTDYSYSVLRKLCEADYLKEEYATIREKGSAFLHCYDRLKQKAAMLSVSELVSELCHETGYLDYVSAMPGGEIRERNLHMLVEKAKDFGTGIFTELSDFIRYVEDMRKYDVNPSGECADIGNVVRLMTIHKSKGLEFPVVFLFRSEDELYHNDNSECFILDADLGIGARSRYVKSRSQRKTYMQTAIELKNKVDSVGEALRLYYVALTRAKEKLIVVGGVNAKSFDKYLSAGRDKREVFGFEEVLSASSFMKLLLHAILQEADEESIAKAKPIGDVWASFDEISCAEWVIVPQTLEKTEIEVSAGPEAVTVSKEDAELLRSFFRFRYPYTNGDIPVKVSVSALKKSAMEEYALVNDHPGIAIEHETVDEEPVPAFMRNQAEVQKPSGAMTGTYFHRMLELHDYKRDGSVEDCIREAEELVAAKFVDKEVLSAVSFKKLSNFYLSEIGMRMKKASLTGNLKREQPFVMRVPANLVSPEYDSSEHVLVQGIVDAFFKEDDGYVLLDYKTDRVPEGEDEQFLIARYRLQLQYYADAIHRATKENVKESLIYSFALQKLIRL